MVILSAAPSFADERRRGGGFETALDQTPTGPSPQRLLTFTATFVDLYRKGLLVPKSCSGVRGDAGQAQRAGPEGHGMGFQKGRVAFDVRDDVRVNSEVLGGLILFHD